MLPCRVAVDGSAVVIGFVHQATAAIFSADPMRSFRGTRVDGMIGKAAVIAAILADLIGKGFGSARIAAETFAAFIGRRIRIAIFADHLRLFVGCGQFGDIVDGSVIAEEFGAESVVADFGGVALIVGAFAGRTQTLQLPLVAEIAIHVVGDGVRHAALIAAETVAVDTCHAEGTCVGATGAAVCVIA